jgi:WD40 repeat protein
MLGGAFGGSDFEEVPAEGALLTGLEVGIGKWNQQDVIHSLQGIFQSRKGRILGTLHGQPQARVVTLEAKAGYAVGSVTVKAGAGLDGLVVTFMVIDGKALDPARAYQSDWIGGVGGLQPVSLVGDGTPIIGIFGRDNKTTTGLGLVSLTAPRGPPVIPEVTVPSPTPPTLAARVAGEVKGVSLFRGGKAALRFGKDSSQAVLLDQREARLYDLVRVQVLKSYPVANRLLFCMAVSGDGKILALGDDGGTVHLRDVETGKEGHKLEHQSAIQSLAFSPDGKHLAVASAGWLLKDGKKAVDDTGKSIRGNYSVVLWNVESGEKEHLFEGTTTATWDAASQTGSRHVAFSGDGALLMASSPKKPVNVWDVPGRKPVPGLQQPGEGSSFHLAAVEKGQVVLGALSGDVILWDPIASKAVKTFRGHTTAITGLAALPGGKQFVSIAGRPTPRVRGRIRPPVDATLRLWDIEKGVEVGRATFPEAPGALSVCADGTHALVAARTGQVRLIDLRKLPVPVGPMAKPATPVRPEDRFAGHTGAVNSVAYSPNGKYLLSGGADGTARLWDVASGAEMHTFKLIKAVDWVCFSANGDHLAVFGQGRGETYETATGKRASFLHFARGSSGCLSPDGQEAVYAGTRALRVHNAQTRMSRSVGKKLQITCTAYSPDGTFYAYGDELGYVHVHSNALNKEVSSYLAHKGSVTCLVIQGGAVPRVISGGSDNRIYTRSGIKLTTVTRLSGHTGNITGLSLSGDGKLLASGSEDRSVRIWEVGTGKILHTLTDERDILGVALSPDGKVVVSCGGKGMRFWNLTDTKP